MEIQICEPLIVRPMPGTSGSRSSTKPTAIVTNV
jgi:hypothetical protein